MQRSLAFILLTLQLLTNTELIQVFKIPGLVSHFYQHRRGNPSISFSHFLAMHYGGDDGTTADDETDRKLPFHNLVNPCLFTSYFPLVQEPYTLDLPDGTTRVYNRYSEPSGLPGYEFRLFRPPLFS